ncbi:hypothetical protein HML84_17510 [Alcanivorax sp. IO_7]|nr:hypothetical protein HML84_17510 [Alcanivorax sp. IO_7]
MWWRWPPGAPAARHGGGAADPLPGVPLLSREPGSGTRLVFEELCQSRGLRPGRRQQLGSQEAIKAGVIAGLGLAVLPGTPVGRSWRPGVW